MKMKTTKRKIIAAVLAAVMVITGMSATGKISKAAEETIVEGTDTVTYEVIAESYEKQLIWDSENFLHYYDTYLDEEVGCRYFSVKPQAGFGDSKDEIWIIDGEDSSIRYWDTPSANGGSLRNIYENGECAYAEAFLVDGMGTVEGYKNLSGEIKVLPWLDVEGTSVALVKETISMTYNGVERTIMFLDNENQDVYLQVGEKGMWYIAYGTLLGIGFDKNGTVWVAEPFNYLAYLNTDVTPDVLSGGMCLVEKSTYVEDSALHYEYIDDVAGLVFDEQNYVIGYKDFDDETHPVLTLDELMAINASDSSPEPTMEPTSEPTESPEPTVIPTAEPAETSIPSKTPTSTKTPELSMSPASTESPVGNSPTITQTPTSNGSEDADISQSISLKQDSGYSAIYVGNQRYSAYKLKKGVLTFKGNKTYKYKKVKTAKYIEKSKKLAYLTKNGKVYTLSLNGKKKLIAKNVEKLICEGGFAIKVKKKNGKYSNISQK